MEDDLKYLAKWKTTSDFWKCKCKVTGRLPALYGKMEDDLFFKVNVRLPALFGKMEDTLYFKVNG